MSNPPRDSESTATEAAAADSGRLADAVRAKYGAAARTLLGEAGPAEDGSARAPGKHGPASCCTAGFEPGCVDPITSGLYSASESGELPESALLASLGCGNPTALADLHAGETVLDLGSGGGIDVILSARRVGPSGKVYGLDMTEEMLALARRNAAEAGATNVEFLRGTIEQIPLPDDSVDVIISNCVINLSGDKRRVLSEAYRVLAPGGRFAVSDLVVRGPLPAAARRSLELWAGCVAGALEENEFRMLLEEAGFRDVDIEPTRVYSSEDARGLLAGAGVESAEDLDGRLMAAFVRARKRRESTASECCEPGCCG